MNAYKNIISSFHILFKKNICIIILILISNYAFSVQQSFTNEISDSIKLKRLLDSTIKYQNSNYNKAYNYAIEGLKLKSVDLIDRIKLLQRAAWIEYYYKNDFDNSMIHLNEMRYLSDSIGFERGIPWADLNLANVYYYQKDFAKSLELDYKAKKGAEIIGDSIIIIDAMIGIGDSYLFYKNDFDSALLFIRQALDYTIKHNRLNDQFLLYDDIAKIYMRKGEYDSSYYYYEKTLDVSKRANNKFAIYCTESNLIYVNYLKDKSYNAIPLLEAIQNKCKKEGFMRLYYEVGYTICEILENRGLFEESLELYKKTRDIEDSITANEKIRKSTEIESEYYLQKKEFENKELERINEIYTLKLKNRQYFIFFVLFILVQAIVLLYIIYKKYKTIKFQEKMIFNQEKQILQKEKEAMEHKIQLQEREMTGKVMKIYQHNQLIQKVIDDIKNIEKILKNEETDRNTVNKKLRSMVNRLKLSSNDQMWTEFEKSFIETNPGYLEKLSDKYPDLTPNEIKLCVFLFLNLRTKDISIITQQSIKSIDVARTRLRKKLQLDNTNINLSVFLRHI